MPYTIRKVRGKPCVSVFNTKTKRKFAKCTTPEKAKKQLRLLNAIHYNKNFVPRNTRNPKKLQNLTRKNRIKN